MVHLEIRPFFRSSEERAEKRREQVRRAQKTFRERRDQYLRLLERQLSRFQSDNARLTADAERLRGEVAALQRRLDLCEEALRLSKRSNPASSDPAESWFQDGAADRFMAFSGTFLEDAAPPVTTIRLEIVNGKPHQLLMGAPEMSGPPPAPEATTYTNFSSPNLARRGTQKGAARPAMAHSPHQRQPSGFVAELDPVIVAMEFVLKLESPCLPHIHDPSTCPVDAHTPQGHMHLLSATLLSCVASSTPTAAATTRPTLTPPPETDNSADTSSWPSPSKALPPTPPQTWDAPRSILSSLLHTSEQLPKEGGEVTPVQAWHCVQGHAGFARLTTSALERLSDKLLVHIKCYGFGGVIKMDFLQGVLREMSG